MRTKFQPVNIRWRYLTVALLALAAALFLLPVLGKKNHGACAAPVLNKQEVFIRRNKSTEVHLRKLSAAQRKKVSWHCSDYKVVRLTRYRNTVRIYARKSGQALVWATYKSRRYFCTVTVGTGRRVSAQTKLWIERRDRQAAADQAEAAKKAALAEAAEEAKKKVPLLMASPTGKKILIVCGHGQGDPGAVSKWGYESTYTRQFGTLVAQKLQQSGAFTVDLFNTSLNLYSQVKKVVTSSMTSKSVIQNALKKNPAIPDLTSYAYILEIHFNAKEVKDPDGNGSYTGIGYYVHGGKSDRTIERTIMNTIADSGFKAWGGYVYSELLNARVCQALGVNYALLETAFIDDGDDMRFYTEDKENMATIAANAVTAYFDAKR